MNFSYQALDVIRQSKVVQILSDGGGTYSPSTNSPRSSSPVGSSAGRMSDKDEVGLREEDKRGGNKREKAFTRLRKSLSNRGQKLMEKMGGTGSGDSDQLSRSSSRDNLSTQARVSGSERISRSTSHLADIRSSQSGHGPNAFHP